VKVGYVALVGRPNVGKSTLLNALLGQKVAIISDKPQTTRISILGIKTTGAGQIVFIDNPGIHRPLHTLNRRMMHFVHSALETADLLCLIIDASEKYGHGDEFVIETLRKVTTPLFLLINKADIVRKDTILPIIDKYKDLLPFKEIIPISALKGTNLEVLEKRIYEFLPEAEKLYDDGTVTDLTLRFQIAEVIREKLLKRVEEELPFTTAVLVDAMEERKDTWEFEGEEGEAGKDSGPEEKEGGQEQAPPSIPTRTGISSAPGSAQNRKAPEIHSPMASADLQTSIAPEAGMQPAEKRAPKKKSSSLRGNDQLQKPSEKQPPTKVTYIRASIFVEKDNQRGIIIGRNGRVIKEIGIEARREIEKILDSVVYLDLKVKVRKRWRDSAEVLDLIEGQR
jgi:GTP-binding protein Era